MSFFNSSWKFETVCTLANWHFLFNAHVFSWSFSGCLSMHLSFTTTNSTNGSEWFCGNKWELSTGKARIVNNVCHWNVGLCETTLLLVECVIIVSATYYKQVHFYILNGVRGLYSACQSNCEWRLWVIIRLLLFREGFDKVNQRQVMALYKKQVPCKMSTFNYYIFRLIAFKWQKREREREGAVHHLVSWAYFNLIF